MNRLVLIGNGFDLAHGLNTRYEHFIDWYWEQRVHGLLHELTDISQDVLCTFKLLNGNFWGSYILPLYSGFNKPTAKEVIQHINNDKEQCKVIPCSFLTNILQSIETKKWVDIENDWRQKI